MSQPPSSPSLPPLRQISGWGRYPRHRAHCLQPADAALPTVVRQMNGIARGAGRSYGDSALADQVLSLDTQSTALQLDQASGLLRCSAALSLATIIDHCLPYGWGLAVVPGTAAVTVGGAIAGDVHGKNHHLDGCFSAWLRAFSLLLADGSRRQCSRSSHTELFHATCGGMGLTGIITDATLQLVPLRSKRIQQQNLRSQSLQETLTLLREHHQSPYSVAWLDCMARGPGMGRAIVFLGDHGASDTGSLTTPAIAAPRLSVPFSTPAWLLNRYSMQLFNSCYYRLAARRPRQVVDYSSFFFPLDTIAHWNRLYGRRGFIQYQFVLPEASSPEGMHAILEVISHSGLGAFLSVLKRFGPANNNLLSFPLQGYTLALDFRISDALFPLLERLDAMVLDFGGRIYLCKDARMSRNTFRRSYPQWEDFVNLRRTLGAQQHFNSLQSRRLGL